MRNSFVFLQSKVLFVYHIPSLQRKSFCVCHGWMVAVWWEKEAPGAQEIWCTALIPDFFLSYYLASILKVCRFHAWLTLILAITCKGKWIINPQGIIEPVQHIYFPPSVSFPLKRLWSLSTLFPFAGMYSKTNRISALTVFDSNCLV